MLQWFHQYVQQWACITFVFNYSRCLLLIGPLPQLNKSYAYCNLWQGSLHWIPTWKKSPYDFIDLFMHFGGKPRCHMDRLEYLNVCGGDEYVRHCMHMKLIWTLTWVWDKWFHHHHHLVLFASVMIEGQISTCKQSRCMHIMLFTCTILFHMVMFPKLVYNWVRYQSPRLDNHFFEWGSDQKYQSNGGLVKIWPP